jgi:hypothetical protein
MPADAVDVRVYSVTAMLLFLFKVRWFELIS